MTMPISPSARLRAAVREEKPLQVVGAINAYAARLAERSGFKARYVSGSGVAAGPLGVPGLGTTSIEEVLTDVRRITDSSDLPVLVDIAARWGGVFSIARAVRSMIKQGAAAVHIDDRVQAKRCGHRPGKAIVSKEEMEGRIKAAVEAKTDPDFVIMARTDALAVEGLDAAIDRACTCDGAGADMIFPEAITGRSRYQKFAKAVKVPILANSTECGPTPLHTVEELRGADGTLILYPLSAFRATSKAALAVCGTIRNEESQKKVISLMQTRAELYDYPDCHAFEQKLGAIISKEKDQERRDGGTIDRSKAVRTAISHFRIDTIHTGTQRNVGLQARGRPSMSFN